MKVIYVIGHRPVDRETGNDNLIFYGLEETTLFRNLQRKQFPMAEGRILTIAGTKYRIMSMCLKSADSLKLWLYPVDTYRSDMNAGKLMHNGSDAGKNERMRLKLSMGQILNIASLLADSKTPVTRDDAAGIADIARTALYGDEDARLESFEPEDHTDDICDCGDPDCNRPMGHSRED